MQYIKKMLAVFAVGGISLFSALSAQAAVYSPVSSILPGVVVSPAGFAQSWYVNGNDAPSNQSLGTVETFLENLAPSLLGDITQVGGANYNTSGFTSIGSNAGQTNMAGNVFSVHFGAGELIFAYTSMVNLFSILVPNGNINDLTDGDVECGGRRSTGCGTGLSNVRVFISDKLIPDPEPVPLPGALVMLVTALGGLGTMSGFRKRAA